MLANASYFSDGSSGLKLIKPEFNTPVEAVIIHAFVLMVPTLVSIFRYEPDQFISFTIVFRLTGIFLLYCAKRVPYPSLTNPSPSPLFLKFR